MKKNILTLLAVCALAIGAKAQTELPLLPAAHGMLGNQPAFTAMQTFEFQLTQGWNWWSTNAILGEGTESVTNLETALGTNATTIKSQASGSAFYDAGLNMWSGNLTSIENDNMYMIKMSSSSTASIRTTFLNSSDVEITARVGWTWVSYPCSSPSSINTALADYVGGGTIKSRNASSFYDETLGIWAGTLSTLVPGQGYKINNVSGSLIQFHFPAGRVQYEVQELNPTVWQADISDYAENMSELNVVYLMDEELRSENFEVGAFVGNECRGVVNLMYNENHDKFYAYQTIMGEGGETIEYRLLDHETGDVYACAPADCSTYETDAVLGSFKSPRALHFNTMLGNMELMAGHINLFPNPVEKGGNVRIDMPVATANGGKMILQVVNALGVTVKSEVLSQGSTMLATGDLTAGIYIVKIIASDKQLYVEKLIVK